MFDAEACWIPNVRRRVSLQTKLPTRPCNRTIFCALLNPFKKVGYSKLTPQAKYFIWGFDSLSGFQFFPYKSSIFHQKIINFFIGYIFLSEIIIDFWYQNWGLGLILTFLGRKSVVYIFSLKKKNWSKRGVISHYVQTYVFNRTISDFLFLFTRWKNQTSKFCLNLSAQQTIVINLKIVISNFFRAHLKMNLRDCEVFFLLNIIN